MAAIVSWEWCKAPPADIPTANNTGPVWELWKSFGIEQAKMVGNWEDNVPVKTHEAELKATGFIKPDKVLISLGNFSRIEKTIQLGINWLALGMSPVYVHISTPEVKDFNSKEAIISGIVFL